MRIFPISVVKDKYFFRKIEAIFTIANELYDQL